ncbi:BrnA antitoxin family protein [Aureimonas leprariae]|uniref:BrnA antitoxin family protein n=1 Tax=Plantimonas leprariae TaxID=2615207 RepID=UPI00192A3262|nr:BrnA antitoxin family protein [Aureimonas leprariae]
MRELTREDMGRMRPFAEMHPELAAAIDARRVPADPSPADSVSVRLDRVIVEHFKAGGAGWQARINEALKNAIRDQG